MAQQKTKPIAHLTDDESRLVKENLNWLFISQILNGAFFEEIKKQNFNARSTAAYIRICAAKARSISNVTIRIKPELVARTLNEYFTGAEEKTGKSYHVELYKLVNDYLPKDGKPNAKMFDDMIADVEQILVYLSDVLEDVRLNRPKQTSIYDALVKTYDTQVLISHILAFKSAILIDGFYVLPNTKAKQKKPKSEVAEA